MRLRISRLAIVALIILSAEAVQALSAGGPVICVERRDGWVENHFEDENIRISFAMANLSTYMRIINKTDRIMRFRWPSASFLLPDGTARTLCFMYEKVVSDGFELVPLTDDERAQLSPPPGVRITKKVEGKTKTALIPGSADLLIPPGCAIFCQLGFNDSRYASASGGSVKGLLPELVKQDVVAESEFYLVLSGFDDESVFEWTLQYDFAGNEISEFVRLKLQ